MKTLPFCRQSCSQYWKLDSKKLYVPRKQHAKFKNKFYSNSSKAHPDPWGIVMGRRENREINGRDEQFI